MNWACSHVYQIHQTPPAAFVGFRSVCSQAMDTSQFDIVPIPSKSNLWVLVSWLHIQFPCELDNILHWSARLWKFCYINLYTLLILCPTPSPQRLSWLNTHVYMYIVHCKSELITTQLRLSLCALFQLMSVIMRIISIDVCLHPHPPAISTHVF